MKSKGTLRGISNVTESGVSRLCAGQSAFSLRLIVLFCVPKENQKITSDFDALDPRERGCSPLSDPKGEVEVEKC